MADGKYSEYANAEPYFALIRGALGALVDGKHFFDIVADDMSMRSATILAGRVWCADAPT